MTELISAYLAHRRAGGSPKATIRTYADVLTMLDRKLPMGLEHAYERELVNIIGQVDEKTGEAHYSPNSQKTITLTVKGFFRYACDPNRAGIGLSYDPSKGLPMPRVPRGVPRPVSDAERELVLADRAGEPYRSWSEIVLLTGLRCSELAGVDLDRGDVDEQRVYVRRGKGGKSREVPTDADLWTLLQTSPLWRNGGTLARRVDDGRPADGRYVSHRTSLHFRRSLKMPGVCLHRMRDTFATDCLDAGIDIRIIQELLGHDSLASTQKYTLVKKVQRENAIRTLHLHRHTSR